MTILVIILMTLSYLFLVMLAFKVVKVKASHPWIAFAVLVGVLLQVGTVVLWKLAAPTTEQMVLRRRVLQIIPDVREVVSEVHVKSNQVVQKGDPLFDVTPDRFENAVDQSTADLAAALSTLSQLESSVAVAQAGNKVATANVGAAKAELETAQNLEEANAGAVAKLKLDEKQQAFLAAQANDKLAEATLKEAEFALKAGKNAVNAARASLQKATFDLSRCTYRSPIDGRVVNMQMSKGTSVARYHFTSSGTVVDLSNTAILAVFPQNQLTNVKPGDKVEIALKRMPGEIVTGEVDLIVKYTGEGQMIPSSKLPDAASIGSRGQLAVRIDLDDEELARLLPLGAAGTVAIYTDFGEPFQLISKIAVRASAWMNYLPF